MTVSGIEKTAVGALARSILQGERKLIICWARGTTQQKYAVATIQEITSVHLLIGAIGKYGFGLCPVRGHSDV